MATNFHLKFSANISTMFTSVELGDRFDAAAECGFNVVEIQNPYELAPEILAVRKKDMKVDLINLHNAPGCASVPMQEDAFVFATDYASLYHTHLNFKKLHILAGEKSNDYTVEDHLQQFISSLKSLLEGDYLQNINVVGLIEPICEEVCPNYFLNSFDQAVEIIKAVNSEHIKLLLDVYHLHKITNNVPEFLPKYYPYAGHIQVSQDPGRREPFAEGGQINYAYVFDFLRQQKHDDYIGLEYFYSGLQNYVYHLLVKTSTDLLRVLSSSKFSNLTFYCIISN